jgi:hypothetical protein
MGPAQESRSTEMTRPVDAPKHEIDYLVLLALVLVISLALYVAA